MTQLIGSNTVYSGTADGVGCNGAEAAQFTCAASGTIDTIQVRESTAGNISGTVTCWAGIFTDSSNLPGTLLGQASIAGNPGANAWWSVTGLSVSVVAGTVYWLAFMGANGTTPSGQLSFPDATTGTGGTLLAGSSFIASSPYDLSHTTGWASVAGYGPVGVFATGTPSGGNTSLLISITC